MIANAFNVPGQIVTDERVRSIQLHRAGSPSSAPIINLNSTQRLQLRFEILQFDSRQFIIRFTHHNPDWSRSSLPPEFYVDGLYNHYISGGEISRSIRPRYRQYSFEFPNRDITFTKSGNYMVQVEDRDTGHLVFAVPFFVMENEGSIVSEVEETVTPRQNHRISHRPVSRYILPDLVDQPQFDLEFYYVQNQFWGRNRRATELDFSSPDDVHFELDRNRPFVGDYEFLTLNLNELSQNNRRVVEAFPEEIPPKLILSDDASGFASGRRIPSAGRYGRPDMGLDTGYGNIVFRFIPGRDINDDEEIYLVGDFNNWAIRPSHRLRHSGNGLWQTNAVIKQGLYHYKYVLLINGEIDDLYFDDRFARTSQEYHAFVYMKDSQEFYYRLLQVNHIVK